MIKNIYININIKLKKQKNHKNINTELSIHQIIEYYYTQSSGHTRFRGELQNVTKEPAKLV